MPKGDWSIELGTMIATGVSMGVGLSGKEIECIEGYWQFRFLPDLRELLQTALPLSPNFPNWRNFKSLELQNWFDWPFKGICFDVEHDQFWLDSWGERPEVLAEAITVARSHFQEAPRLVPIYSHRYIPAEPNERGNPVFSVYQTDVIYYGADLRSYVMTEFGEVSHADAVANIEKRIPFWADLTELD